MKEQIRTHWCHINSLDLVMLISLNSFWWCLVMKKNMNNIHIGQYPYYMFLFLTICCFLTIFDDVLTHMMIDDWCYDMITLRFNGYTVNGDNSKDNIGQKIIHLSQTILMVLWLWERKPLLLMGHWWSRNYFRRRIWGMFLGLAFPCYLHGLVWFGLVYLHYDTGYYQNHMWTHRPLVPLDKECTMK